MNEVENIRAQILTAVVGVSLIIGGAIVFDKWQTYRLNKQLEKIKAQSNLTIAE